MTSGDLLTVPTRIDVYGLPEPLCLPAGSRVRVVGVTQTSLGVLVEVDVGGGRRVTLPKRVLTREPGTRGK